jgi:hypothetical protein
VVEVGPYAEHILSDRTPAFGRGFGCFAAGAQVRGRGQRCAGVVGPVGRRRPGSVGAVRPRPLARRSRRRPARGPALLLLAVLLGAAACQSRVALDARVERDGSGVVNVGLGLDDAALQRVGDLDRQVRVGDLAAAGWQVSRAHKEDDGLMWLRASKPFRSIEDLNGVLTEVTGPPAVLRDVRLVDEDVGTATVHHLAGTVDLSSGLALVADPQLAARLGGDPAAARVAAIEQAEGRPLRDLVTVDVTAHLADAGVQTLHPTLGAGPTALDVAVREDKPVASVGGGVPIGAFVLGGGVVGAMLVAARRRFAGTTAGEPPVPVPALAGAGAGAEIDRAGGAPGADESVVVAQVGADAGDAVDEPGGFDDADGRPVAGAVDREPAVGGAEDGPAAAGALAAGDADGEPVGGTGVDGEPLIAVAVPGGSVGGADSVAGDDHGTDPDDDRPAEETPAGATS